MRIKTEHGKLIKQIFANTPYRATCALRTFPHLGAEVTKICGIKEYIRLLSYRYCAWRFRMTGYITYTNFKVLPNLQVTLVLFCLPRYKHDARNPYKCTIGQKPRNSFGK